MKFTHIMKFVIMKRKPLVALGPEDVASGVHSFPPAVAASPALQERLANARAWYAVRNSEGGWTLAPSKWAGYVAMTAERYLEDSDAMDGRLTEKRLRQWFTPLAAGTDLHKELMAELRGFLASYGKQPNSAVRISVLPDHPGEAPEADDLVALLVRVAKALPPGQRSRVVRELGG